MNRREFMQLADDGCPHCGDEFKYNNRFSAFLRDRARKSDPSYVPPRQPFVTHGPRGSLFCGTGHLVDRWDERFGLPLNELLHAVKFSRIIGRSPCGRFVALWYEADGAFFICKRVGLRSFAVMTCLPSYFFDGGPNDKHGALVGSYRARVKAVAA